MKLFVSNRLWRYRDNEIKIVCLDKKRRSKLIIPKLKTDGQSYESVELVLPVKNYKLMNTSKDLTIECSEVRSKENRYVFESSETEMGRHIYALLQCGAGNTLEGFKSSDIYIPVEMKNKVKIIEKIQFYEDLKSDNTNNLVEVYLVRIVLSKMESIPFYLTSKNPTSLKRHLVFRRDDIGRLDVDEYKTYIFLNSNNKSEYISLSEL